MLLWTNRHSLIAASIVACARVLSPLGPSTLGAQGGTSTIVAGVADAETGEALEGAEVLLVRLHRLARANGLGEATVTGVPRGVQRLRVRRLGYAPAEVDIAVTGDTTGAVFRLQRTAVQLGAVNVQAEWTPPKMKAVEARRRQGIGRFLNEVDLDKDRDRDFHLVMSTRFPGLTTVIDPSGNRVLASRRGVNGMGGVGACYVTIYLDDMLMGLQDAELIRTWDLATVEYYDGMQVPVRYRTKSYQCGVLLLWSKWY